MPEIAQNYAETLLYAIRTSDKNFGVLRIPQTQNILTFVLQPRKILEFKVNAKENQRPPSCPRLIFLAFPLGLTGFGTEWDVYQDILSLRDT